MKKLIEFFRHDWEGEYQQYFYAVDDEEKFIQEVLTYLNTVQINTEHPWSDCLEKFKGGNVIEQHFLRADLDHLNEYYYIQDDENKFTLTKYTDIYRQEDIVWNQEKE